MRLGLLFAARMACRRGRCNLICLLLFVLGSAAIRVLALRQSPCKKPEVSRIRLTRDCDHLRKVKWPLNEALPRFPTTEHRGRLEGINRGIAGRGMTMAKHSYERGYPKHTALLAALFLPVGAIALVPDTGWAQQQRTAATRTDTGRTDTTTVAMPNPDTPALGQALAACNRDAEKEPFTLPGLKGEVTLDRCYKGRAHLSCVFEALGTEANSLTGTYPNIVDAKYPELNTVDRVCQVSQQTLAADITGSEDFAKRFKELKSQYEAATKCVVTVEQAFKEVSLVGLTKAPEVVQSMAASIDGDVAKTSKVYEQISNLSTKMEVANKAMKMVTKLHHAMCMNERSAEPPGRAAHR
jgi:hypothetical protein